MSYFYVKNSLGTRTTGGGLTKQSGSFASLGAASVYATIQLAITDGATSGDFICVSDLHSLSTSSAITYTGPSSGEFLYIVSVDDANCDAAKVATAAQETCTSSTADIIYSGRHYIDGIWLKTNDYIRASSNNVQLIGQNLTLECAGSSDVFSLFPDGTCVTLTDCTIKGVSGAKWNIISGSSLKMFGGSTTLVSEFTGSVGADNFTAGGGTVELVGVDLSTITGTIFKDVGSAATTDDLINLKVTGCKLNASVAFLNETFENLNHRLVVTNSSSSSAAAEYQFHTAAYGGVVDDETSFYRDGSTAFPAGQKISLKIVTDTNANKGSPFSFTCPTRFAALSSTATDNIRIYLLSSATLYDSDIWVEAVYPDGTTKHLYNYISERHPDIMDTNGTALSTNTEAWTGRTTENRYHIDIDTSSDAGADTVPIINVYVGVASTTIYLCPSVDLS